MSRPVELDWNATTPLRAEARDAWLAAVERWPGNPSSVHRLGQEAHAAWERCADRAAELLAARPHELVFTSGGTEAIATAINAALTPRPGRMLAAASDHSAVLRGGERHPACHGLVPLAVDRAGRLDLAALSAALDAECSLVACHLANNELGTVQDFAAIGALVHERAPQARLLVDACQAVGKWPLDLGALDADFVAVAGHKFGAPRGSGLLWVRTGVPLPALLAGGRQQDDRRSGSHDLAGFAALVAALEVAEQQRADECRRQAALLGSAFDAIQAELPACRWLAHEAERIANTMNLTHPAVDGEALITRLDLAGVCASRGAACMARSGRPSHVIEALGIDAELARGAIRVSTGWTTTAEDLRSFVTAYVAAVREMLG